MFYVHINRNIIDSNRKNDRNEPPITIKEGKRGQSRTAYSVRITDGCIRYDRDPILPCGARVVIETEVEPLVLE